MNLFRKKQRDAEDELLLEIPGLPQGTSYFGKNLNIHGNVTGDDHLHIDGEIEGKIDVNSDVKISNSASINGDIKASCIKNSGVVKGDMVASDKLSLEKTAKVKGKITTPSISIAEGAIFDGEVEMNDNGAKKST